MTLRKDWPLGLRALFWLSASGVVIGSGQLFALVVLRGELGPPPTLQGTYAVLAYALNLGVLYAGLRSRRRAFVLTTCATAMLSLFVTAHFLAETFGRWSASGEGGMAFPTADIVRELPYVFWNLAVVTVAAVVVWYLVSTHLLVVDDRVPDRSSPLPPPVEVDAKKSSS